MRVLRIQCASPKNLRGEAGWTSPRAVQPQGGSLKHVISLLLRFRCDSYAHFPQRSELSAAPAIRFAGKRSVTGRRLIEERLSCGISVRFGHGPPTPEAERVSRNEHAMFGRFGQPAGPQPAAHIEKESRRRRLTRNSEENHIHAKIRERSRLRPERGMVASWRVAGFESFDCRRPHQLPGGRWSGLSVVAVLGENEEQVERRLRQRNLSLVGSVSSSPHGDFMRRVVAFGRGSCDKANRPAG